MSDEKLPSLECLQSGRKTVRYSQKVRDWERVLEYREWSRYRRRLANLDHLSDVAAVVAGGGGTAAAMRRGGREKSRLDVNAPPFTPDFDPSSNLLPHKQALGERLFPRVVNINAVGAIDVDRGGEGGILFLFVVGKCS